MSEGQFIKISRELLYNEIWEISVSGVAKKYNVPYAELLRLCKRIEVPIPPSGYWVKLRFGKPVEKIPLPESAQSEAILPILDTKGIIEKTGAKSFVGVKEAVTQQQALAF